MSERKKVAIFIDYSLRIPSFKESYEIFKRTLFQDNLDTSFEDELTAQDPRFYWQRQLQSPEIMKFYVSINPENIDDTKLLGEFSSYFFNEEHYAKFLEEYSFNLYADCPVPSLSDVNIINIAQANLFDITLIDKYHSTRKITNTLFFLSKIRVFSQTITFLSPQQSLKEDNYIGIWNPLENKSQRNKSGSDAFLNWMKELEKKYIIEQQD